MSKKQLSTEILELKTQVSIHAISMDLLAHLAKIVNESEAVEAMLDVYAFLFAPKRLCYLSYRDGCPDKLWFRSDSEVADEEKRPCKTT